MIVVVIAVAVMMVMAMRAVAVCDGRAVRVPVMLRLLLLLFLHLPVMRRRLVVLAQEVDAVIVAVRRAHDGVHMEFRRLGVGQKHAGVVVELDEDHRALDAVVERARLRETADPAEMSRVMPLDLGKPRGTRAARQHAKVFLHEVEEIPPLQRGEVAAGQAF